MPVNVASSVLCVFFLWISLRFDHVARLYDIWIRIFLIGSCVILLSVSLHSCCLTRCFFELVDFVLRCYMHPVIMKDCVEMLRKEPIGGRATVG